MQSAAAVMDDPFEHERREHPLGRCRHDVIVADLRDHEARLTAVERSVSRLATEVEVRVLVPMEDVLEALGWLRDAIQLVRKVLCPMARAVEWCGRKIPWLLLAAGAISAVAHGHGADALNLLRELFP